MAITSPGRHNPQPPCGRRKGRTLSAPKAKALKDGLSLYEVSLDQLSKIQEKTVVLEIGFGDGRHLLGRAMAAPDTLFLGCEIFENGIASLCQGILKNKVTNVRIFPHDANVLACALPDQSVETIYLLFPDPWPKKKHRKRRMVNAESLKEFSRVLNTGGTLVFASDNAAYVNWTLMHVLATDFFDWRARDWHQPPTGWVPTKYEQKTNNHQDTCAYFTFVKIS